MGLLVANARDIMESKLNGAQDPRHHNKKPPFKKFRSGKCTGTVGQLEMNKAQWDKWKCIRHSGTTGKERGTAGQLERNEAQWDSRK